MLFFVTGASGSGKSACLPGLAAALPDMDWHDFDAFGVPDPCPRGWRPRTTERWIQVALKNQETGVDTGIAGGAILGEIMACPSAPRVNGIHVALLDCADLERLDRLWRRGTHGATQDMLSWAAWQRVHAVEPQWWQHVVVNHELEEMRWERWTHLKRGDPAWQVEMFDTMARTVADTVAELAAWVQSKRVGRADPKLV